MKQTELIQELRSIGLSDKSAQVYATVLEMGVAFPSKVAEATKLNRTTVYKILTDLSVKGLVTEIERNKKLCYQIERPGRLVNFTKSQIHMAEERAERAKKMLPEIEGLFSLVPNKPRVRFFEGLSGVLAVYEDHLSEPEKYEMVGFSNIEKVVEQFSASFLKSYVNKKARLGITTRGIFPKSSYNSAYNKTVYRGVDEKYLVKYRTIPAESFPYTGEIVMYGKHKVSVISFHERGLVGVIIEDETIAGMMRMAFELAWASATPQR